MPVNNAPEAVSTSAEAIDEQALNFNAANAKLDKKISVLKTQLAAIEDYLLAKRNNGLEQQVDAENNSTWQSVNLDSIPTLPSAIKAWIDNELAQTEVSSFEMISVQFKTLVLEESDQASEILINFLKNAWLIYTKLLGEIKLKQNELEHYLEINQHVIDFFDPIKAYLLFRQQADQIKLEKITKFFVQMQAQLTIDSLAEFKTFCAVDIATGHQEFTEIQTELDKLITVAFQQEQLHEFAIIKKFCEEIIVDYLQDDYTLVLNTVTCEWQATLKLLQELHATQQQVKLKTAMAQQAFELANYFIKVKLVLERSKNSNQATLDKLKTTQALHNAELLPTDLNLLEIYTIKQTCSSGLFKEDAELAKVVETELLENHAKTFEPILEILKVRCDKLFGSSNLLTKQFVAHWNLVQILLTELYFINAEIIKNCDLLSAKQIEKHEIEYASLDAVLPLEQVVLIDPAAEPEQFKIELHHYLDEKTKFYLALYEEIKKIGIAFKVASANHMVKDLTLYRTQLQTVENKKFSYNIKLDLQFAKCIDAVIDNENLLDVVAIIAESQALMSAVEVKVKFDIEQILPSQSPELKQAITSVITGKKLMSNEIALLEEAFLEFEERLLKKSYVNLNQSLPDLARAASEHLSPIPRMQPKKSLSASCEESIGKVKRRLFDFFASADDESESPTQFSRNQLLSRSFNQL